ncbi:hypothetical protein IHV12_18015 [Fictibacillus sp. 7GRE50]|nr:MULTISPECIES: transporter associated domain-containing protein [unclassified Fictibacillus]MBH0166818.1 hypothetical protein [Fictibacillus sp. 7GRE50]MBH0173563.1 hypothetical protein [Fictibacillus sp. 23RED33]
MKIKYSIYFIRKAFSSYSLTDLSEKDTTPCNPKPRRIYFCVSIGSDKTVLHGKVLFSEVNDLFGLHLSDEDVDTIGG